jgi:AhpD family alkylhydroperoxidase
MTHRARIPFVEPGTRPELADIERSIIAERGRISALYRALLNSAPVAEGWEKLLTAVRNRTSISAALRELMILRVAVLNDAPYEFDAHVPHALKAGMTERQIDAVRTWPAAGDEGAAGGDQGAAGGQGAAPFDADARLLLALTDAMTRQIHVSDELMDRVRQRFDARGTVEIVTTIAAYNMVSRFLVALEITH